MSDRFPLKPEVMGGRRRSFADNENPVEVLFEHIAMGCRSMKVLDAYPNLRRT